MIPCPKIPIFTYGSLNASHKTIVLAGKIEGSMRGKLEGYKLINTSTNNNSLLREDTIVKSDNPKDSVSGEILWINLENYQTLIKKLDSYGNAEDKESPSADKTSYQRILCEPITDEPVYRGIRPTHIKCWTYQIK
jgi:hypothetical protein